jgi:hypothetical protein
MSDEAKNADFDRRPEVEIPLEFPVTLDGSLVSSVTMRRPKGRDSIKASRAKGNDAEKVASLMADLVNLPMEHFVELDEVDIEAIQAQYNRFKPASETPAR